jgi:hypothetical protein
MEIEQTNDLIEVPNRIIQGVVNAVISAVKINPEEIACSRIVAARDHLFDELTLPDETSKTNFMHALKRLLLSKSKYIDPRM